VSSRLLLSALLFTTWCSACGVVKNVRLREDYDAVDKKETVRLAVVTAPLTEGGEQTGLLYSRIARRYANHHRDFLAKTETASIAVPANLCGEGIEGVLHLIPGLKRVGESVTASVQAQLYRCRDQEEVWSARAGGTWPSADPTVTQVIAQYSEELGKEVEPYVAPVFHLLRALLEELPRPILSDTDVIEKIELGD
jgi:probable lipoprotein (TIGR04455 family)